MIFWAPHTKTFGFVNGRIIVLEYISIWPQQYRRKEKSICHHWRSLRSDQLNTMIEPFAQCGKHVIQIVGFFQCTLTINLIVCGKQIYWIKHSSNYQVFRCMSTSLTLPSNVSFVVPLSYFVIDTCHTVANDLFFFSNVNITILLIIFIYSL